MKSARPFNAMVLGAKLGVLVTIVLAVWLPLVKASNTGHSYTHVERIYASILATLIMLAPSVIAGTLLGHLAQSLRMPPWSRRLVIAGTACVTVLVLGELTGLGDFVLRACVPVGVAALYLEHRARSSASGPVALASKVR